MKMNKKITAMILSAVIAAAPVVAPVMEAQTVAAATTTTKTLKNTWSKDGRYYYDQNGRKVTGVKKINKKYAVYYYYTQTWHDECCGPSVWYHHAGKRCFYPCIGRSGRKSADKINS